MNCQKLDETTLFQLFESCQKVELKLSKPVTVLCQYIVRMLARLYLMMLYAIFPIPLNFLFRSSCVFKGINYRKKLWIVLRFQDLTMLFTMYVPTLTFIGICMILDISTLTHMFIFSL